MDDISKNGGLIQLLESGSSAGCKLPLVNWKLSLVNNPCKMVCDKAWVQPSCSLIADSGWLHHMVIPMGPIDLIQGTPNTVYQHKPLPSQSNLSLVFVVLIIANTGA